MANMDLPGEGRSNLGETNWAALQRGDVEHVVLAYWKPIQRFLLSRLGDGATADDLTQEFFLRFVEKDRLARADPARGRFRNYLFQMARNFLVDWRREVGARRRGGDAAHVPIDAAVPAAAGTTPDEDFDATWFLDLVHRARRALKSHYVARDRLEVYQAFRLFYFGDRDPGHWSQKRIAEELGLTTATVNNHVHRAREVYSKILRELVSDYSGSEKAAEEEFRDMVGFLQGHRVAGAPTSTLFGDADPDLAAPADEVA